ncbi:MAG: hypothetical protein KAS32_21260, partial [Candidatus Peribacteraceae bacterium]|nr:hypothetical protein [Candidatus Peribacteraceae bacterium]
EYIALGGLVPLSARKTVLKAHLDKCFHFIFKKFKTTGKMPKIHGFGMTNFSIWKLYPFYSVDSTSWNMGGRIPYMLYFENDKLRYYTKNFNKTDLKNIQCHKNPARILNRINIIAFIKAQQFVTRLWDARGIKFTN